MPTELKLPSSSKCLELLSDEERSILAKYGNFRDVDEFHTLINHGQKQQKLFVLIEGAFEFNAPRANNTALIGTFPLGEVVGEMGVFSGLSSSATVKVSTKASYWWIDKKDLNSFFEDNPEIGVKLMEGIVANLSHRIHNLYQK
jgi:CRP-like cAMP-binding protein